jgi:diguanylate cyclase (GGDEF)-like protein
MRILIVDDVPDNIRVLSRMLADEGHHLTAATSGREALELAEIWMPDLILLDIMMPEMDGYEVCTTLKATSQLSEIPVIFITALADADDETHGLSLGAVDYITKPFKEAVVRLRVRTHLELKRQRDLLDRLCHLDSLTGIPNRRAFDEQFDREWRRAIRAQEPLAAAMIDIDHFKEYNDTYGHPAGDSCLRQVAGILAEGLNRGGDFVARYGGEEFICLFIGADVRGVEAVGEKLRAAIEALRIPHATSPVSPWVTVSVGSAICQPTSEILPVTLVEAADAQLFLAKRSGRNRVNQVTVC